MKAPEALHAADNVKSPVLLIVIGPLAVVVTAPLKVKLAPVSAMPLNAFVFTTPEKVVVPVPASCTIAAARMPAKFAVAVCVRVSVLRRVMDPIAPLVVMLPVPAFKVKFWAPLTVPVIEILPAPAPLLSVVVPIKLIGPAKPIAVLFVITLPLINTGPVPVWLKAPAD